MLKVAKKVKLGIGNGYGDVMLVEDERGGFFLVVEAITDHTPEVFEGMGSTTQLEITREIFQELCKVTGQWKAAGLSELSRETIDRAREHAKAGRKFEAMRDIWYGDRSMGLMDAKHYVEENFAAELQEAQERRKVGEVC